MGVEVLKRCRPASRGTVVGTLARSLWSERALFGYEIGEPARRWPASVPVFEAGKALKNDQKG